MSGLFCLWNGSVRVYRVTASQAYVCATVECATDTNAVKHRVDVIDSWAEGLLAPFWFYFSLEVSSGNSDACYSLSAKQLFAVWRMKGKSYHYAKSFLTSTGFFPFFFLAISHSKWDMKAFKVSSLNFIATIFLYCPNVALCFHIQIWSTLLF